MSDRIGWLPEPEEQDYPAALSYLELLFAPEQASQIVDRLRAADVATFKAKDIFRASGLSLLGISNLHVEKDRRKIATGKELSPLLLVRGDGRLIVADGYHRMCAVYSMDEDALIPCKIV
ncbi:MAG TPA: hypothetical protein VMU36_03605 [Spirochaetia bacterium]|nr:hypothetical protein [Spirochaetia bacterium]